MPEARFTPSNYLRDRFFAPGLSALTKCGAPELDVDVAAMEWWLPHFQLNATFRVSIATPYRQLIYALIRRVDGCVQEYLTGRRALLLYLTPAEGGKLMQYSRALLHFESCLAFAWQSWELARRIVPDAPLLFERNDGSDVQRLHDLHILSKHSDRFLPNVTKDDAPALAVWLTNAGLRSERHTLEFRELADLLSTLWRIADNIANWRGPVAATAAVTPARRADE